MRIVKFLVKAISSIFILIFGLLCLITTTFLLIKNMTTQENISQYVKNANIFDYSTRDIISDSQNSTLRQTIKNEMLNIDIPGLVVDEVIDSKELDILISDYIYDYSNYIIYNMNKPVFPSDNILNILMEKYQTQEGKALSEKQKEKSLKYIELLGSNIDRGTLDKDEIDEMISISIIKQIASIFTSQFMPIVLGIIMVAIIAMISICLGSIKKAINWCSKITILDGIFLIIASFVEVRVLIMYFNSQGLIDSLVISIVENGFQNMLIYGVLLIVLGIIFMTISAILIKKEKNSKKDKIIDNSLNQIDKPKIKDNEVLQEIPKIDNQHSKEDISKDNEKEETQESNNENESEMNKTNDRQIDNQNEPKEETKEKIQEEIQIIPDSTEEPEEPEEPTTTEIIIEDPISNEEDIEPETELTEEYSEINDDKIEEEPIKKEDRVITPMKEINIEVTYPKKGKDVEFNHVEEDQEDEEIEIL